MIAEWSNQVIQTDSALLANIALKRFQDIQTISRMPMSTIEKRLFR